MNIGLDMMGGDLAPLEAVKGVLQYLEEENSPATLVLIGNKEQLDPLLLEYPVPADRFKVVHAEQVIGMHEHPTKALKEKQQSSIAIGFHLLASGKIDAFISAGNTGAMLVGALIHYQSTGRSTTADHFYHYPQRKWRHGIIAGCRLEC